MSTCSPTLASWPPRPANGEDLVGIGPEDLHKDDDVDILPDVERKIGAWDAHLTGTEQDDEQSGAEGSAKGKQARRVCTGRVPVIEAHDGERHDGDGQPSIRLTRWSIGPEEHRLDSGTGQAVRAQRAKGEEPKGEYASEGRLFLKGAVR